MKLTNKFLILSFFIANISYAQDWVKTDITDFASINFPIESKLTKNQVETVYSAEDEFAFYIVSIRKLTDQQSSQITQKDIPSLYQGVVQGTMDAAKAKIISMNEIILQNTPALELEYNASANPNIPSHRYKRIIYINKNIINIDFWPLTNEKNIISEKKTKYFNSFLINLNKNEVSKTPIIKNDNTDKSNSGFEIGVLIGQIAYYIALIVFLIGIFLLIRYLLKKLKNN